MNVFDIQLRESIRDRVDREGSAKCIYCGDPDFSVKPYAAVHDPMFDFSVRCTRCKSWYPGIILKPIVAH